MASNPITSWQIEGGKVEAVTDFIFLGLKITADGNYSREIKRHLLLGKKSCDKPRQHVKKQGHCFTDKGLYCQSYALFSSHVWLWELDHKEGWMLKNWCFWIVVLEKTLENLLDSKEIKPVNPKGNQPLTFIERTDTETEFQILWPSDEKSWLIEKDPNAGKDWGQEEKGVAEDEMFGWHHWCNGHEFKLTPGDNGGQRSLGWCSPCGCKELDMT